MTSVLIADDQRQNRYLLETLFEGHGFDVSVAENGADALEMARKSPPSMIITDILMPVMDGFELCRQWKLDPCLRDIPFIFYTATYLDRKDEEFAHSLGADRFLTKPQRPEALMEVVQEVLRQRVVASEAAPEKPLADEMDLLRQHNEALFRRLERKMSQLESEIAERRQAQESLSRALVELQSLKDRIAAENVYLHGELAQGASFEDIVGESDVMRYILFRVEQVARTDATVLLLGETGTGKGLVARAVHRGSHRSGKPFVTINCSALPATLVESELFGREKGSFTGATSQIGRFELADGGTLFLDEIGDLPIELQPKLLRALQDGEFERVGSPRTIKVDVRIIAATHRNLAEEVRLGRFRKDLFYRLNVIPITLPALRDHREDIPALAGHLVARFSARHARQIGPVPQAVLAALHNYDWPGNVRELENIVERAVLTSPGAELQLAEPLVVSTSDAEGAESTPVSPGLVSTDALEAVERSHIRQVLERTRWQIEGASGAAAVLGINPSTMRARMRKLGIKRE